MVSQLGLEDGDLVFTLEQHGVLGYLRVCDDLRGFCLLRLVQLVAGELRAEVGHHLVVDLLVVHALGLPLPPATSGNITIKEQSNIIQYYGLPFMGLAAGDSLAMLDVLVALIQGLGKS